MKVPVREKCSGTLNNDLRRKNLLPIELNYDRRIRPENFFFYVTKQKEIQCDERYVKVVELEHRRFLHARKHRGLHNPGIPG